MKTFRVRQVGTESGVLIEAHNELHAVAEAAGCTVTQVCLPIWRTLGGPRWNPQPTEQCYMPLDNTGRQWAVTYPQQGASA